MPKSGLILKELAQTIAHRVSRLLERDAENSYLVTDEVPRGIDGSAMHDMHLVKFFSHIQFSMKQVISLLHTDPNVRTIAENLTQT